MRREISGFLRLARAVLPIVLVVPGSIEAAESPTFRLVEAPSGIEFVSRTGDGTMDYIVEANGNGTVLFDYDRDGDLDLLLVSGSTLDRWEEGGEDRVVALYSGDGGGRFEDVTAASGLAMRGWGMGACTGDYDGDGAVDLYVTALGDNALFRNDGDGTFSEVTLEAGVADDRWSHSCAFGDYDADGVLDLYVANYVDFDRESIRPRGPSTPCGYRGHPTFCGPLGLEAESDSLFRGRVDGRFEAMDGGLSEATARYGMNVVFADLDDDGFPDIYVANDSQPNLLFRGVESGVPEEVAQLAGLALGERGQPQASMGIAVGDYDNDGDLDLYLTNFSQDYNTLYRNHGEGFFSDVSVLAGVAQVSDPELGWGTVFVDFDLDGYLDLFVANGHVYEDVETFEIGSTHEQADQLLLGGPGGRFVDVGVEVGLTETGSSRGVAAGDLDGDGDTDLAVTRLNDRPLVLRNEGGSRHAWVAVTAHEATGSPAQGTRVVLLGPNGPRAGEVGGMGGYLGQSEPSVRWGLGENDRVEALRVRFLSGTTLRFRDLPGRVHYRVPRPLTEKPVSSPEAAP